VIVRETKVSDVSGVKEHMSPEEVPEAITRGSKGEREIDMKATIPKSISSQRIAISVRPNAEQLKTPKSERTADEKPVIDASDRIDFLQGFHNASSESGLNDNIVEKEKGKIVLEFHFVLMKPNVTTKETRTFLLQSKQTAFRWQYRVISSVARQNVFDR